MNNTDRFSGVTYFPSDKILGKVKISVNPQCAPYENGGFKVLGNWLSNTEEMSEKYALKIAQNLIKQGCAVIAPVYTNSNEKVAKEGVNPSPTGRSCYWEWRSFNGGDFEFVLFEVG